MMTVGKIFMIMANDVLESCLIYEGSAARTACEMYKILLENIAQLKFPKI